LSLSIKRIDLERQEKKIEGAYFKEDLRRVQIHEIGNVAPSQVMDATAGLLRSI